MAMKCANGCGVVLFSDKTICLRCEGMLEGDKQAVVTKIKMNRMAEGLAFAAHEFRNYAQVHMNKQTPEGDVKAQKNLDHALKLEDIIAKFGPNA